MLVSEDEASFLIKKKKKKRERRERGEQFPVGILTLRELGQPCLPLLQLAFMCRRSLTGHVQNPFYNSNWGLPVQADLGFKEVSAPLSSAFNARLRLPVSLRFKA